MASTPGWIHHSFCTRAPRSNRLWRHSLCLSFCSFCPATRRSRPACFVVRNQSTFLGASMASSKLPRQCGYLRSDMCDLFGITSLLWPIAGGTCPVSCYVSGLLPISPLSFSSLPPKAATKPTQHNLTTMDPSFPLREYLWLCGKSNIKS